MPQPTVTAVIPCYNHGQFVGEAVRSCLAQAGADVRVVVVDDGSDDGTTGAACDACRALPGADGRVEVIHQANAGLPAARNRGARWEGGAGTEYLVFLDADDWIEPGFVAALHARVVEEDATAGGMNGEAGVSHGYCQERLVELGTGIWRVPDWDPVLMLVTNLHPVTALVRRACFEAVGGFDASMREGYEDWDLWLKFVERGWRGVRVREPLFVWRRHSATTMVIEAARRHEALFRTIMANHPALYERHAAEIIARSNALLRRADANWLDEEHEPIVVRALRSWNEDLVRERDAARAEVAEGAARLESARAEMAVLRATVAALEAKPVVRLSRAFHRALEALPRPLGGPARGVLRGLKRGVGPGAREGTR